MPSNDPTKSKSSSSSFTEKGEAPPLKWFERLSTLTKTSKKPTEKSLSLLGQEKRLRGNYPAALVDFDAALKENPKDLNALKYRGELRRLMGDYAGAQQDFSEYLKRNPKDPGIQALHAEMQRVLKVLPAIKEDSPSTETEAWDSVSIRSLYKKEGMTFSPTAGRQVLWSEPPRKPATTPKPLNAILPPLKYK